MPKIRLILMFLLLSGTVLAQPCYLFTGKGKEPTSFQDPQNWGPRGGKQIQGAPKEIEPGTGAYRYSLHIFTSVELRIGPGDARSFSEALNLVQGRLTLLPDHKLTFLNLKKDTGGKGNLGNNIQGESTITLNPGSSLILEGNAYIDKFRHLDPLPWILLNDAAFMIKGSTTFLAGLIKLNGNSVFDAGTINFGKHSNTGTIDFASKSASRVRIGKILFNDEEVDYQRLIHSRNILIDGKPARARDFKVENGVLSLAR